MQASIERPARVIEVTDDGARRHVRTLIPQAERYRYDELVTEWPADLLHALADLKQDYFWDSYARFEHPNYVQKAVDITLSLYGLSLAGKRVLDFGAGFGASTHCLLKRGAGSIVLADLVAANTNFAERFFSCVWPGKVEVRTGDIIPTLGENEYDVIWVHAVIEHLTRAERREYLPRFWSALRPGGHLIITETPNRCWPRETHTTGGRWWLPWMSDPAVFARLRREDKYRDWTDEEFYRSGIIGSTYTEILDCLGRPVDCEELALRVRAYIRHLYRAAQKKSPARGAVVAVVSLWEPVWRVLTRKPATSFLPYLQHLAFRKRPT
jgi:2-polyprenyl-3-methyl-5-hydroxy-6-metoxy-1,4-benzoquinol methylase